MPYLKPDDVGDGLTMTFINLSEIKQKKKKDGGTFGVHELLVKHHDGRTETYDVFPKAVKFGKLNTCHFNDQIMAFANGDFVNWKVLGQGEETLSAEQPSNYKQKKREVALAEQDNTQKIKEVFISLQGLTQSYIIAGHPEPLQAAIEMRKQIIEAAISQAQND